jgi:hypothetical protein
MKARALIESATFGPETLKVMTQAFDAAWACVADRFGGDEQVAEAREQLAFAILAVTDDQTTDDELLKCKALSVFALSYADP